MKKHIRGNVYWVGKVDWELQQFHGNEYSTHSGSTYNSYLLQEEKTVLIDTVWEPFSEEFIANLESEIDLKQIDFIVVNHGEVDHSGALPALMRKIPDTPIYCTANAVTSLKGQYHQEWDFHVVKTGDALDVGGGKQLVFVEMKMLHWPDSMACYLTGGDNILFSNDAFGQHYATDRLYNDLVDQCGLFQEAIKYYANILAPFSAILRKKLDEIIAMNLSIDIIATSHGVIWRDNPMQIVEKYAAWANDYQEDKVLVLYDTMWNGTKRLAEKISEGVQLELPETQVRVFNIAKRDINDLITELFTAKALIIGSPTIGKNILHAVAGFLHMAKEMGFKKKRAAAFGCYGWSGESVKVLNTMLEDAGFTLLHEGMRVQYNPDEQQLEEALAYGRELAGMLKE